MASEDLFVKMALDAWHTQVNHANNLLGRLPDEQMTQEIAPGKNRGSYLLGHLAAVHDRMLPLLGLGHPLYPQLYKPFVESPDKAATDVPGVPDLRQYWQEVNEKLASGFSSFAPADWFQKHSAVSEEDFAKEPHRNKLNIIINRTAHLANHFGQLLLLEQKEN